MTLKYVLITPARNEAGFLDGLLRSVAAQTHLPVRWVIVNDGSSDNTDEVVRRWQQGRPWIELVSRPARANRDFAAKVQAFNAGLERLAGLDYDVIGNIDGDVTFDADYLEFLVGRFAAAPRLGVAGTHYIEGGFHSFEDSYISVEHVNGQCQLFRRECFEDIGGYKPNAGGGIDWVAVTTARMKGWQTRSFAERVFHHHRKMGTAGGSELMARFHYGKKDYFLGGHPAWQIARSAFQIGKRPYLIGGAALMAGYLWQSANGGRSVSPELMAFHQKEQMQRLKGLLRRKLRLGRDSALDAESAA
jgi:glycosyltransferase involved in cell wall biosynthesis